MDIDGRCAELVGFIANIVCEHAGGGDFFLVGSASQIVKCLCASGGSSDILRELQLGGVLRQFHDIDIAHWAEGGVRGLDEFGPGVGPEEFFGSDFGWEDEECLDGWQYLVYY
ncbi:hypothetical protein HYFRA_00002190 [Hymenoscyphus fraxineus]|uniref:Uncharacterized protein n=1 Tax=Hymenoscyphus fraxineus TaxID=746836 RepID=A0A9N9KLB7_9HELO|nr:hypothetical protein HYFRA_00002190 [Hymenoscyphus fraxineus]